MEKRMYIHAEGETEVTFDDLEFQLLGKIDCYDSTYECRGTDTDGNIYSGISSISCGECVDIEDIEFVEPAGFKAMQALYKAEVNAGIYDPKNPNQSLADKMADGRLLK